MSTTSILPLPPAEAIDRAAHELATVAAGNTPWLASISKAQYHLRLGLDIVTIANGFLVPSATRGGCIHRVSFAGECDCEAGRAGRMHCWHRTAIRLIEDAQRYTISLPDRIAARRAVSYETAIDDLYGPAR